MTHHLALQKYTILAQVLLVHNTFNPLFTPSNPSSFASIHSRYSTCLSSRTYLGIKRNLSGRPKPYIAKRTANIIRVSVLGAPTTKAGVPSSTGIRCLALKIFSSRTARLDATKPHLLKRPALRHTLLQSAKNSKVATEQENRPDFLSTSSLLSLPHCP